MTVKRLRATDELKEKVAEMPRDSPRCFEAGGARQAGVSAAGLCRGLPESGRLGHAAPSFWDWIPQRSAET